MFVQRTTACALGSLLGVVGLMPTLGFCQDKGSKPVSEVVPLVLEAFLNSSTTFKSGMGKGTFKVRREWADGKVEAKSGKLTVYVKGNKYRIQIDFDDSKDSSFVRKVIISDGADLLYSSDFWREPVGGVRSGGSVDYAFRDNKPSVAGFPWNPSRPWVVEFDQLLKNVPAEKLTVANIPAQGYQLRYDVGTQGSFTVIEFLEKYGWNASKRISYRDAQTPPFQIFETTWAQQEGQWYVDSLTYQMDTRFRDDELSRWTLKYQTFEVNCPVDDTHFTIDALGLEEGSRILEFVPNEPTRQFRYQKSRSTAPKELDKILADVRALPRIDAEPVRSSGRFWFGIVSAALMVSGLLLLIYRRRRALAG